MDKQPVNEQPVIPPLGSRVSVRYRERDGVATDVIGRLIAGPPRIAVRTPAGEVTIIPDDVLAVRELSHRPVRNSEIRALEHAAALAWPGIERHWHRGWLLRAGDDTTSRGNSAVPLDFSAAVSDIAAIAEWYSHRGLEPWLAVAERLLPLRAAGIKRTRVMVREIADGPAREPDRGDVRLLDRPDAAWLAGYGRDVPVAELTSVVDGEVVFARLGDVAVGRGAVTATPDGTRWLGISSVAVSDDHRRRGHGRLLCERLAAWGAARGARRSYVQVLTDNEPAGALYASLGFGLHHHARYLDARRLLESGGRSRGARGHNLYP